MKHALSESFIYSVKDWLFNFPPHRCSVLLRDLLLDHISCTHECGLPPDFKETIEHIQALFRLLAEAEVEVSDWEDPFDEEEETEEDENEDEDENQNHDVEEEPEEIESIKK